MAMIAAAGRLARKKKVGGLIRVGVSLIMLAIIFHIVPPARILASIRKVSLATWFLALVSFLCGHVVAALKWRLLIGDRIPVSSTLRAHLAGLSANIALPGVAGGDLVRAALVVPFVRSKSQLAVASLMDRLIDTLGLLLIALVGSWLLLQGRDHAIRLFLLVAIAGGIGGGMAVLLASHSLGHWLTRRGKGGKLAAKLALLLRAIGEFAQRPGRLLLCFALSVSVQSLFIVINIWIARDVGLQLPAAAWFEAWSIAKIIAILPISFGGLGVREASMAALLKPLGASPQKVIAVGLIWQTILFTSGFLGIAVQSLVSKPRGVAIADAKIGIPL